MKIINAINENKLSHNVYSDDDTITSTKDVKYLIFIQKNGKLPEIIPANNITTAIEIAKLNKCLCSLFERKGSMGKNWQYMIDMGEML